MGRTEIRTKFWLENLRETDHSQDLGVDGDNIKMDFREIKWADVDWINVA
jgi:hypothetical protein